MAVGGFALFTHAERAVVDRLLDGRCDDWRQAENEGHRQHVACEGGEVPIRRMQNHEAAGLDGGLALAKRGGNHQRSPSQSHQAHR